MAICWVYKDTAACQPLDGSERVDRSCESALVTPPRGEGAGRVFGTREPRGSQTPVAR